MQNMQISIGDGLPGVVAESEFLCGLGGSSLRDLRLRAFARRKHEKPLNAKDAKEEPQRAQRNSNSTTGFMSI
jgi:hypothetical protein